MHVIETAKAGVTIWLKRFGVYVSIAVGVLALAGAGAAIAIFESELDGFQVDSLRVQSEMSILTGRVHAAEMQCAIANENVLNIDRNYRNLKQLETHYINKSFTDK